MGLKLVILSHMETLVLMWVAQCAIHAHYIFLDFHASNCTFNNFSVGLLRIVLNVRLLRGDIVWCVHNYYCTYYNAIL